MCRCSVCEQAVLLASGKNGGGQKDLVHDVFNTYPSNLLEAAVERLKDYGLITKTKKVCCSRLYFCRCCSQIVTLCTL